jgi:hypothetical protein
MDALDELLLPILNRAAWLADCSDGDSSTAASASTGAADLAYVRSVLASLERLARVAGTRAMPLHAASNEDFQRDGAADIAAAEHFSLWCSDELRIALRRHGLV